MRNLLKVKLASSFLGVACLGVACLGSVGCGGASGGGTVENPSGRTDSSGNQVSVEAANRFKEGMKLLTGGDKAGSWTTAKCQASADKFNAAAEEQADAGQFFKEAHYNAGLSYQRCGMHKEAREKFEQILDKDDGYHQARVQIAVYKFADSGGKDIEGAISEMKRAISDSKFKNVEALVGLANFQMRRGNNNSDSDGANDFARAKKNLQRALAVDDAFMPAFNQLAVYYLETAKQKAGIVRSKYARGSKVKKADTQALELAALVCSQAIQKNPTYAPVHNTAGLISVQLENLNAAVQSFNRARQLDKNFFEAHMNYASVNMKFRGFEQAASAYKEAIRLQPNDYDANLGLALALRGQIDDSNFDQMLKAASAQLEKVKKINPARPEAYFNDAILTAEFKTKAGGKGANTHLAKAKELFKQFVSKAGSDQEFAEAVKDVTRTPTKTDKQCSVPGSRHDEACKKGRLMEIDEIIEFNKQTAEMQKQMEQDMKQRQAEEDAASL